MNQEDFIDFFSKLLVETEKIDDSATLFSLHKINQDQQDQSPISEPPNQVAPTQDQADTGVIDTPFEEAVPLEDELAHLLDDIDD
ncbi:MAG: hypothetical protein E2P05_02225 [Acidobacteria bacterium]|nr:MAG: hypothetical protein E2P05_02225 [Acidobacteriota bacterium]